MTIAQCDTEKIERGTSANPPPPLAAALSALPYLILLAGAYRVFALAAIGPFVTFRYAENILAGYGPVYNPGEHVEGFSSPLHLALVTLLMAQLPAIGIYFKAKVLGVVLGLIGIWQIRSLALQLGLPKWPAAGCQMLVALNVNYACAAVNGLETTLYLCILLAAASVFLRERETDSGCWSSVLLFMALLTRPEAALLFLFLLGLSLSDVVKSRTGLKRLLEWTAIYAALALVFLSWRWSFYGLLVPNTYFAKAVPLKTAFTSGITYLALVWSPQQPQSRLWTVLSSLVFWGLTLLGLWKNREHKDIAVVVLFVAAGIAFILKSGGGSGLGWRYLEPEAPFIAILQVWGILAAADWFTLRSPAIPTRLLVAAATSFVWVCAFERVTGLSWAHAQYTMSDSKFLSSGSAGRGSQWLNTAEYIRTHAPEGSLVAAPDTGYMAFENPGLRFLDLRGLTDHEIATVPGRYKSAIGVTDKNWYSPGDPVYSVIMRRHPDYIISYSAQEIHLPGYAVLQGDTPAKFFVPILHPRMAEQGGL